jgi:hypothetical protein
VAKAYKIGDKIFLNLLRERPLAKLCKYGIILTDQAKEYLNAYPKNACFRHPYHLEYGQKRARIPSSRKRGIQFLDRRAT